MVAPLSSRTVQLTDWLPPEFSAVSQYALQIAEREAAAGAEVTVIGLSSDGAPCQERSVGAGFVRVIPVRRRRYTKDSWPRRLVWSVITNITLVANAWPYMRRAEVVRFTGSPPFLLHFVACANLFLRKRLTYRITDFYPECITAALGRPSRLLALVQSATDAMRRRVDLFEAIGNDMKLRLLEAGIPADRIVLSRDSSPVQIDDYTSPLPVPDELVGKKLLLYSGNWGVAHDVRTFLGGYIEHHLRGSGAVMLWLNATGSGANEVDQVLTQAKVPFFRQKLVPLADLQRLLVTPDAHLITLKPEFVGFVLPSKVYGCLATKKPIIYIGPSTSDVHELCKDSENPRYRRVEIGDSNGLADVLDQIGRGWPCVGLSSQPLAAAPSE